MTYDTTEAVAKFLSGFQMKITNRETVPTTSYRTTMISRVAQTLMS